MRVTRRSLAAVITAVLLIVGLAPGAFAASEDSLLSKLNAERSSRGLAVLASHWDLVDDAEAHSNLMMAEDNLHHNPNLASVTTGWVALGENVGVGPSVSSIHAAFMNSSAHRGNILGDYTHVGIGAVRESDDKLWVTVVFMKAAGGTPTTTTAAPTTTTGAPPVATTTSLPPAVPPPTTTQSPTEARPRGAGVSEDPRLPASGIADELVAAPGHTTRLHQPRPD